MIRHNQKWTENEISFLKNNWDKMSNKKISEFLKRNYQAIRIKGLRLGLIQNNKQNQYKIDNINNTAIIYLENRKGAIKAEAIIDLEDLDRVINFGKWRLSNKYICTKNNFPLHRFLLNTNSFIDHKDGNRFNNCKLNLRKCTQAQNNQNKNKSSSNTRLRGVHLRKDTNKFTAYLTLNKVKYYLGSFRTIEEANQVVKFGRAYSMPFSKEAEEILLNEIPQWIKDRIDKRII